MESWYFPLPLELSLTSVMCSQINFAFLLSAQDVVKLILNIKGSWIRTGANQCFILHWYFRLFQLCDSMTLFTNDESEKAMEVKLPSLQLPGPGSDLWHHHNWAAPSDVSCVLTNITSAGLHQGASQCIGPQGCITLAHCEDDVVFLVCSHSEAAMISSMSRRQIHLFQILCLPQVLST